MYFFAQEILCLIDQRLQDREIKCNRGFFCLLVFLLSFNYFCTPSHFLIQNNLSNEKTNFHFFLYLGYLIWHVAHQVTELKVYAYFKIAFSSKKKSKRELILADVLDDKIRYKVSIIVWMWDQYTHSHWQKTNKTKNCIKDFI